MLLVRRHRRNSLSVELEKGPLSFCRRRAMKLTSHERRRYHRLLARSGKIGAVAGQEIAIRRFSGGGMACQVQHH